MNRSYEWSSGTGRSNQIEYLGGCRWQDAWRFLQNSANRFRLGHKRREESRHGTGRTRRII